MLSLLAILSTVFGFSHLLPTYATPVADGAWNTYNTTGTHPLKFTRANMATVIGISQECLRYYCGIMPH